MTFGGNQRCPEGDKQVYFTWDTLRGLGQRFQQRQSVTKVTDRFDMCRALDGALSCFLPIVNGLLCETCLSVMMCQEFWLCLSDLWELGFQNVCNTLMVVLPRAF